MKTTIQLGLIIIAAMVISACQSNGNNQSAAPAAPPSQAPAADASSAGSDRLRSFVPPSDGKLTAVQVEQYIAVRRRALEIAREGKAATPIAMLTEIPPAEARAANELGRDIAEYRWVQARIAEATTPDLPAGAAEVLKAIEASAMKRGAELQKAATDEHRTAAPVAADAAAVAYNRGVIDPFRTELAAVEKS